MPSLKSIRNRIRSVKSTQQITRAMKMISAARLRRAQEAVLAARPYSQKMDQVLEGIASRANLAAHPLLAAREKKKVEVVVLTSDRGLCGGFNANIIRRTQRFLYENEDRYQAITLRTLGRKGHEFFRRRGAAIRQDHAGLLSKLVFGAAESLARELTELYLSGEVDGVSLVYNEFVSAVTQRVAVVDLLPISPPKAEQAHGGASAVEYLYEPGRDALLADLLPRYLATKVWRAMLESVASEHGARMSAMDNATNNAREMIGKLTLLYNRSRQAAITKELMEIVSGAEALK
jgi:F-type H+-transporting ATPase subunit gamma